MTSYDFACIKFCDGCRDVSVADGGPLTVVGSTRVACVYSALLALVPGRWVRKSESRLARTGEVGNIVRENYYRTDSFMT
jgi:hypothetical protein